MYLTSVSASKYLSGFEATFNLCKVLYGGIALKEVLSTLKIK